LAFTPNFSSSQSAADLTTATFTDTSTGSDPTISTRLIYLRKYDGTYLVPSGSTTDFIAWPISDVSIDISVLDQDYCLDVVVYWLVGSTLTYNKNILTLFTGYGDVFLRQLTQAVSANRELINRANYWQNKIKLRTLLDDAAQATSFLNDQTVTSFCLVEAKKLTDNISTFF